MKKIILLFTASLILFFSLTQGCSKKEPVCACGVEHPEENIVWLKEYLTTLWSANIYKVNFLGDEYIIISDKEIVIDGIAIVFNCQGLKLCEEGGENIGGHMCDFNDPKNFWDTYNDNRVLLFTLWAQEIIFPK